MSSEPIEITLRLSPSEVERIAKDMDETQVRLHHAASVFEMLWDAHANGSFGDDQGRFGAVCELVGIAFRTIAEQEGETVGTFSTTLRTALRAAQQPKGKAA